MPPAELNMIAPPRARMETDVKESLSYKPTGNVFEKSKRDLQIQTRVRFEVMFRVLWDQTEYALCSGAKRLRDMNGIEVSMVAGAMDTLRIMQTEARALMRVSDAIGHDRILKKVMKKDEFVEFCLARSVQPISD